MTAVTKVNAKQKKTAGKSLGRRIAPPLFFVLGIFLLVVFCYDAGYSGLPPTEKRYATAKAAIASLKLDEKKNRQREPWEKLAREFKAIYEHDPAWANRTAALFRAGESLEELAKRSLSKSDARKAVECFESLALRHASSRLADDALFHAARIRATYLRDDQGAISLLLRLKKQYPKGDMLAEAQALEKAIRASANGRTAPEAVHLASSQGYESSDDASFGENSAKKREQPLGKRYEKAKASLANLGDDKLKACWRQPWENLREEFLAIYKESRTTRAASIAPGALFHAAKSQESLARCSNQAKELRQASELYLSLAEDYPKSAYADDALLSAAKITSLRFGGSAYALRLLERLIREYPRGEAVAEARKLKTQWQAENKASSARYQKEAALAELQSLAWDSPNKDKVEIVLELSAPAQFSTRLIKEGRNKGAKLQLDLEKASVNADIRKGVSVRDSLLTAIAARENGNSSSSLTFSFREVGDFEAVSDPDSSRIVLKISSLAAARAEKARAQRKPSDALPKARPVAQNLVGDMASQLGLSVQRVFIDAGHGGRDPGTSHNRILERSLTLDVALTLGRMLENNGLEVIYSRKRDNAVSLSERTRLANSARADLFVSIHVNASENREINGLETYYLSLASNPHAARVAMLENAGSDHRLSDMQRVLADVMLNARIEESKRLALDIQRLSMFRLKRREFESHNNGIKSAPFHVLLGAQMPAVLVELGYCTNAKDALNLANPKYRYALAEGLAEGILAYRDRLLKQRTVENSLTKSKAESM